MRNRHAFFLNTLKIRFLYHSNKLEGSSFSEKALWSLYLDRMVEKAEEGYRTLDDIIESWNSFGVFDQVMDSLGQPLTKDVICMWNRSLLKGTRLDSQGLVNGYKVLPNRIIGSGVRLALPEEVEPCMNELLSYEVKTLEDIMHFHSRFEQIHPFQDGNGRIGRLIMLKQCMENELDLIVINCSDKQEYMKALEQSELYGDYSGLKELFEKSRIT